MTAANASQPINRAIQQLASYIYEDLAVSVGCL